MSLFDDAFSPNYMAALASGDPNAAAIPVSQTPIPDTVAQPAFSPNFMASMSAPAVDSQPFPEASPLPRISFLDSMSKLGNALMMAGGPISQQMLIDRQNHELAMQQGQGALQQNQIDLAKGQNDLSDHAIARMATMSPILADAYAKGGAVGMANAWDKWAPVMGLSPDKIAAMHQFIQSDPEGTLKHLQEMAAPADKGPTAAGAQVGEYIRAHGTPEQYAAYIESISHPNAIKPAQQAALDLRKQGVVIQAYKAAHPAANAVPSGWTPEVIDTMAQQVRANPYLIRSVPKGVQAQVLDRVRQMGDPHDIAGQAAAFKSDQGSLTFLQKQTDALVAAQNEAKANGQLVLQALGPGAAKTGSPAFNKWVQWGREDLGGDPDVTALNRAIHDYTGVAAKIVERSTGSVRAAGAQAQAQLEKNINSAKAPAQIIAAMHQFDMAIANSRAGNEAQIAAIRQRMRPQSQQRPAAPASSPKIIRFDAQGRRIS